MRLTLKVSFWVIVFIIPLNILLAQDPWNNGYYCESDPEIPTETEVPNFTCNLDSPFWSQSNRFYFIPSGQEMFDAHLNIIVLQKEGVEAGNWVEGDLFENIISNAVDELNNQYYNLCTLPPEAYADCFDTTLGEPVNIPSINIHFSYDLFFIEDDDYWGTVGPKYNLTQSINSNPLYQKGVNIYYTMDSVTYRLMVHENELDPNGVNFNWINTLPSQTNMDLNQYMVLPNKYAEFVYYLNNYAADSAAAINHQIEKFSRIWGHELGHIFGLKHNSISSHYTSNECEYSIMHQGSPIACWLPPSEIGEIHRLLHTSNTRRYIETYTYFSTLRYIVEDTMVWDYNIRAYSDIVVEKGAELKITCKLYMPSEAKIIVKQGARLLVDEGLITSHDTIPWQGIQVWGDETAHQYPDANGNYQQGYLKLINGATIENAIIAIDLWEPGDYSTTGGIVHATDAIFRNNAKSIHALHYNNYNPYDTTQEMDYNSNFKNCTFEITENYLGDETFYKHVDLAHVKGIDFQGCDFSLAENVDGVSTWNHAIAGYDAKFGVKAICNSQQTPCPEEDYNRSTFTGFYSAINAVNDGGSIVAFNINRADFIDNAYGVKTREMNNASVLFSDFEIGYLGNCGAGIYSDDVTGFAFEENNFSKYSVGPQGNSPGNYFGIVINNSEAVNKVYKNTFDGLSYANFSDGKNWRDDYRYEGLVYYCNQNSNNYADFYVADYVYPNHSGIQSFQGNDNYTAGNSFTQNGATWHFYNGGEHLVSYYYNQNQNDETPDGDKIYHVAKVGRNVINNCPSHYGGSSELKLVLTAQQKADAEQDYYDNLTDYNSVKTLYDSYVDGGDTEAEKLDIQTAQPEDMWELRAQLLGDSPHLSLEVLKKAADKTDVFTESALFDILAANPDELKKDTLISYLENKEEPLPEYMIDLLKQLAEGTTYKTALQQQMAGYKHAYTRAAHDIIRSNLNDTVTDNVELRNWLDNLGGITSDRQIIATYISEDNFAEALALANMLPQLYQLEGNELTEHNYYMDMLSLHQTLYQEGRNTFQLDSTEKANIIFIANNSKGVAGAQAKSILEGVYEEYFDDCPDADGSAGCKSSSTINPNVLGRAYGLNISVKPNPAKQWAAFDYTLPGDETEATITITNATGAVIEILEVNGKQGQKLWDTRKVKPGVYIYTIKLAGFSQSGKIVIRK
jgi:hypothetical protein